MPSIHDLPSPALLLDLDVLERNVRRMAEKAHRLGVALRPHFKTSKCVEVARLQRDHGATGHTVATLEEARTLFAHGFDDVTWAFPVIPSRLTEARELDRPERGTRLRLTVDTPEALAAVQATGHPFHVWLEVDSGDHRSGVDPQGDAAVSLAHRLASSRTLTFDGLLTHGGHTYEAEGGRPELKRVADSERDVVVGLARRLREEGIDVPGVSLGSTPGMSAVEDLDGVTEARPGNYVFYDYMQERLGSCRITDCAVTVLATVISCQPGAEHSVTDTGALALSKDPGPEPDCMGRLVELEQPGRLREDVQLTGLSQEHGVASAPLPVGSKVRILPNHSCLTVACWDEFHVLRGLDLVDRWKIWRKR